jgi:hypothetical protein
MDVTSPSRRPVTRRVASISLLPSFITFSRMVMSKRRPIDAVSDGEEEEYPRSKRARVVNQDEGVDVDGTTAPAPSTLSRGKRRKAQDEDGEDDDDDDEIDEDADARLEAEQGARIRAAIENKGKSHGVRHFIFPLFSVISAAN